MKKAIYSIEILNTYRNLIDKSELIYKYFDIVLDKAQFIW